MRKRNHKKPAAVLAALALTTALLAGCGSTAATTESTAESTAASESKAVSSEETADEGDADEVAAKNCADLIDAIYVQERNDDTDAQCEAAKAAWDALTDTQKKMVEGENADPEYFGRDTGDAGQDDPRNGDEIGENELLVVSFGTSFNGSRAADIKGVEDALQAAYPDWSVRRAFTAQIIINHVPVSYTHLDVYKRQAQQPGQRVPPKGQRHRQIDKRCQQLCQRVQPGQRGVPHRKII